LTVVISVFKVDEAAAAADLGDDGQTDEEEEEAIDLCDDLREKRHALDMKKDELKQLQEALDEKIKSGTLK
jgi:hypothetical protein